MDMIAIFLKERRDVLSLSYLSFASSLSVFRMHILEISSYILAFDQRLLQCIAYSQIQEISRDGFRYVLLILPSIKQ